MSSPEPRSASSASSCCRARPEWARAVPLHYTRYGEAVIAWHAGRAAECADTLAEVLARSLERIRHRALRDGVDGAGEFETVLAALRDPSFTFVDALHVAAWGRPLVAGLAIAGSG